MFSKGTSGLFGNVADVTPVLPWMNVSPVRRTLTLSPESRITASGNFAEP